MQGVLTVSCKGVVNVPSNFEIILNLTTSQGAGCPQNVASATSIADFQSCSSAVGQSSPAYASFDSRSTCRAHCPNLMSGTNTTLVWTRPGPDGVASGPLVIDDGAQCVASRSLRRTCGSATATGATVRVTCPKTHLIRFTVEAPMNSSLSAFYVTRCTQLQTQNCHELTSVARLAANAGLRRKHNIQQSNTKAAGYRLSWEVVMAPTGCSCQSVFVAVSAVVEVPAGSSGSNSK
jgi:hypothetical protein